MKRITIYKADGDVISGKVTRIEFEGTDGGYPVYTAFIKGNDGVEYLASVASDDDRKMESEYEQDKDPDFTDEWVYPK